MDGHALEPATLRDVLVDELMNEVFALGLLRQRDLRFLGHVVTLLTIFLILSRRGRVSLICPKTGMKYYTKRRWKKQGGRRLFLQKNGGLRSLQVHALQTAASDAVRQNDGGCVHRRAGQQNGDLADQGGAVHGVQPAQAGEMD